MKFRFYDERFFHFGKLAELEDGKAVPPLNEYYLADK